MKSGAALRSLREFRAKAKEAVMQREKEVAAAGEEEKRRREREEQDARASVAHDRKTGDDGFFYAPAPSRSVGVGTEDA